VSRSCKYLIRVGGDHKLKVAKRCGKKLKKVLEVLDGVV
jgi:hypothetical protein